MFSNIYFNCIFPLWSQGWKHLCNVH